MSKKKKKNRILKKIIRWTIRHKVASLIIGVLIIAGIATGIAFAASSNSDNNEKESTKTEAKKDGPAKTGTDDRKTDAPIESKYLIKVNRALNCITVYEKTAPNEFNKPVIAFPCSTGRQDGHETPLGEFSISWKSEWCLMVDGTYGQYTSCFNGDILFHSVPYFGTVDKDRTNLEYEQYNKLGDFASLGCVRLCVADAKWIYENCPSGTKVIVYDDYSSPGPLGKPASIKLPYGDTTLMSALGEANVLRYCGWDPTDPHGDNPWNKFTIAPGTAKVGAGSSIASALDQIPAYSPDGAKVPGSYLTITNGAVDMNTPGTYNVKVGYNKDYLPASGEADVTIVVTAEAPAPAPLNPEKDTTVKPTTAPSVEPKPVQKRSFTVLEPIVITVKDSQAGYAELFSKWIYSNLNPEDYPNCELTIHQISGAVDFTKPGKYEIQVGYVDQTITDKSENNKPITVTVTVVQ